MLTRYLPLAAASLVLSALSGCRDAQITSYRIPKEVPKAAAPGGGAETGGASPHLHYTTPEGWTEQPSDGVRLASFTISGEDGQKADMAVTQFPGDVGGDLANVNRWRGQLQLGPIEAAQLSEYVTAVETPRGTYQLTELVSETPVLDGKHHAKILGAWIKQPERTWFFKMSGHAKLVDEQRNAFLSFLRSAEVATDDHSHPPTPASAAVGSPHGPSPAGAASLSWTAPAEWRVKPLSPMRKGSFALPGAAGAEADFSIISFPGDAGGIVDNVNRWRGQIDLPPLEASQMAGNAQTVASGDFRFTVVDYVAASGTPPTRIVAAVLPLEAETYFFKVTGPAPVVEQHKPAFLTFLKSVKPQSP